MVKIVKACIDPSCLTPVFNFVDNLPDKQEAKKNNIYVVNGDTKVGYALSDEGEFVTLDLYPLEYDVVSTDNTVTVRKSQAGNILTFDLTTDEDSKVITEDRIREIILQEQARTKALTEYQVTFSRAVQATSDNLGYRKLTYNEASGLGIIHLDFHAVNEISNTGTILGRLPDNAPTPRALIETLFYLDETHPVRVWVEAGQRTISVGSLPADRRVILDLYGYFND